MPATVERPIHYLIFDDGDWEEIDSIVSDVFKPAADDGMTRPQWVHVALASLGKAQLIEDGHYDMGDEEEGDNESWADQLRGIAESILENFKPGDGKL